MASALKLQIIHDNKLYESNTVYQFSIISLDSEPDTSKLTAKCSLQSFPSMNLNGGVTVIVKGYIGAKHIFTKKFLTSSLSIKKGESSHLIDCLVNAIDLSDYFGEEPNVE